MKVRQSKRAISRMLVAAIIVIIIIIAVVAAAYVYYMPGAAATTLSVSLNSPSNGATQYTRAATFTYTPVCIGDNIFNASLLMNGLSVESNTTNVQNNTVNSFSYTFTASGTYKWNVQVFNSTIGVSASSNYTLIVASAGVSVALNTPVDGANQSVGTLPTTVTFTYTPVSVGDNIANASLWVNVTGTWQSVASNTTVQNNALNSFNCTFTSAGTYIWNVQVFNSTTGVYAFSNNTLTVRIITGTVTIWHALLPNELTAWNTQISLFEAAYPGVTVNMVQKTSAGMHDALTAAIPAGQGPDLYTWGAEDWQGEFVNASLILPIDTYIDNATLAAYYPSALSAMTYKGHLWALPLSAECLTLFYNKAYITTPPTTTDQMVALMHNESAKGGTAPYQYGLSYVTLNDPYHLFPWVSGWGGYYYNDTTGLVGLNSSGTIQAASWFNSTILPYLAPDLGGASQDALFEQNKSAMLVDGDWEVANVKNAGISFGLSLIPMISQNNNATPMPFEGVKGIWMTSNVKDANKDADIAFMKWFTGATNQIALGKTLGYIPVTYDAYKDTTIQNDPVISGFGNQLKYTIPIPNNAQMGDVWTGATNAWNAVVQGTQTAQVAFQQAEDSVITNIQTKYGHYP
ncbi:MAG: extracellular solute-binding protein [Candidatus Bathyarchaeia archaeon]